MNSKKLSSKQENSPKGHYSKESRSEIVEPPNPVEEEMQDLGLVRGYIRNHSNAYRRTYGRDIRSYLN